MTNLAEELSREIARVSALQAQYEGLRKMAGVNVGPVLSMIGTALEEAHKAMGSGDIEPMMHALADLRGYTA